MDYAQLNFKELYQVALKTTYPMEIGNRSLEVGETIALFDKIQFSIIQGEQDLTIANGGYLNSTRVIWESLKEITFNFSQGVFSKTELALLMNSKIYEAAATDALKVPEVEVLESDQNSLIQLKYVPEEDLFCYKVSTGEKINLVQVSEKVFRVDATYETYQIFYTWLYTSDFTQLIAGRNLISGFLSMDARTRVKDDKTGAVVTGLLHIPKLKLVSNLSIQLGRDANPIVANFSAIGVPVNNRTNREIMSIVYLSDDLDSDM